MKTVANLHCYSKVNRKANLRSFKDKVTLSYHGDLVRDIASGEKKMTFPYSHHKFHSDSIRVGANHALGRSVILHNSQSTVNLTYTHKNTDSVITDCNLTL